MLTGGFSEQELRDAGAREVFTSVDELRQSLPQDLLDLAALAVVVGSRQTAALPRHEPAALRQPEGVTEATRSPESGLDGPA